jgi:hypothetical protein
MEIYAKIRFEPIVSSSDGVSSGTLMSSSFVSTNSSNWHNSSNVDVECASVLCLWNSMHSKLDSNSLFKQVNCAIRFQRITFIRLEIIGEYEGGWSY